LIAVDALRNEACGSSRRADCLGRLAAASEIA
jgi:hypothetical protein